MALSQQQSINVSPHEGDGSIDYNVERCLIDAARSMAIEITNRDPQFVVKRLYFDQEKNEDSYKIIYGMPETSARHGLGERGPIAGKVALEKAISTGRMRVINNPESNPDTQYMHGHVQDKNILATAIIPIKSNGGIHYLIAIDKAHPQTKGFSFKELLYLKQQKKELENWGIASARSCISRNQYNLLLKIINSLGHNVRNQNLIIGGFGRRVSVGEDIVNSKMYGKLIHEAASYCDINLQLYDSILPYAILPLTENDTLIPAKDIIAVFEMDENFMQSEGSAVGDEIVIGPPQRLAELCDKFRDYLVKLLKWRAKFSPDDSLMQSIGFEANPNGSFFSIKFVHPLFEKIAEANNLIEAAFSQVGGIVSLNNSGMQLELRKNI